jgi:hypothetical protein
MAKKGLTLCAGCSELTPSTGGFCRLCRTPLIQAQPAENEGHCPVCGTLVGLDEPICYGCGWRLQLPRSMVFMIAVCMLSLSVLFVLASLGLWIRFRYGT